MVEALVPDDLGDLVIDGVYGDEPVTEGAEALAGELERGGVAVDADDPGVLALRQDGLGVTAEPERAVDQDGTLVGQGRRQESDDPIEEDRSVAGRAHRWRPTGPGA